MKTLIKIKRTFDSTGKCSYKKCIFNTRRLKINIRKVNKEDFDDILNLQLQLEDTEIKLDCNLKERCYETIKGKEKLKNRINNKKTFFMLL